MFATTIPSYSAPVPTVFNSTLSSAFENAKFTLSNGPNDILTKLGNKATITADADATLIQNRDCTVLMPNTANRVITLPSAAGQIFPILIQKTSNNYNTITVNRASAPDTIDNPYGVIATPVNLSFTLNLPGEAYLFIPSGTFWRVEVLSESTQMYRASAFRSTNQALTGGITFDRVNFQSEVFDLGGFYDNATNFRFQPLIAGLYQLDTNVIISSGTTSDAVLRIRKAGADIRQVGQVNTSGNYGITYSFLTAMNGTTDTLDVTANAAVGRSILGEGAGQFSVTTCSLIRRT